MSAICSPGSCQWCGCHFRRPSDVLYHRCAAMQEALKSECEHAGHEWADAGGGLAICGVCQAEQWAAPDTESGR